MKKVLALITIVMLLLGLVACSSSSPPDSNSATNDTPATEAEDTRVVQTPKGSIEIPANPQRIVSDYYLGEFLALGVKPIIASPYSLDNPFLAGEVSGIERLNITSSETSLEMIIAAEPDLIITLSEADYDNYSKIAPTVLILDGAQTPEERFYFIGEMLGKRAEAVAYMDGLKADAAAVRGAVTSIVDGRTVSFIEIWPGEIYVMGSHFARGGSILFDLWGLKAPESVQASMVDGDVQYETVALEALPEYAGDFVFYSTLAGADDAFVAESAVWSNLPAVQNGLTKEYEQVAFMHTDPISLRGQLDFYIDYFTSLP